MGIDEYFFGVLASSSMLVLCIFVSKLYYFHRMRQHPKRYDLQLEYASIISIFFGVCTMICLTLLAAYHEFGNYVYFININNDFFYDGLLYRSAWIFWSIATVFCYFSFMLRLNRVFDRTSFAISKRLNMTFFILVILFFILETSATVIYFCYFFNIVSLTFYETIHLILMIFETIIDGTLTILFVKLFINKLTNVMLTLSRVSSFNQIKLTSILKPSISNYSKSDTNKLTVNNGTSKKKKKKFSTWVSSHGGSPTVISLNNSNSMTDNEIANNINLDNKQTELINVITKYNILGIFAVISTQIFCFMDLLFIIIVLITDNKKFELESDTYILPIIWIIDAITNVSCMFLNTKNTQFWYYRICSVCDKYCRQQRTFKTKKQIINKIRIESMASIESVNNIPLLEDVDN